jgi:hypothetical protein
MMTWLSHFMTWLMFHRYMFMFYDMIWACLWPMTCLWLMIWAWYDLCFMFYVYELMTWHVLCYGRASDMTYTEQNMTWQHYVMIWHDLAALFYDMTWPWHDMFYVLMMTYVYDLCYDLWYVFQWYVLWTWYDMTWIWQWPWHDLWHIMTWYDIWLMSRISSLLFLSIWLMTLNLWHSFSFLFLSYDVFSFSSSRHKWWRDLFAYMTWRAVTSTYHNIWYGMTWYDMSINYDMMLSSSSLSLIT